MAVDINQIRKLREKTNISVAECKKALGEAKGDFKEALAVLKKKGIETVEKKKERETREGIIGIYLHQNKKVGAMVKVLCESDFASKNETLRDFAHNLAMQIVAMDPKNVDELFSQPYVKDVKKSIRDLTQEVIVKVGENIKIEEFQRIEI